MSMPRTSALDTLKKHYRKVVRPYHPDINSDPGAKQVFLAMTDARNKIESELDSMISRDAAKFVGSLEKRSVRQDLLRRIITYA